MQLINVFLPRNHTFILYCKNINIIHKQNFINLTNKHLIILVQSTFITFINLLYNICKRFVVYTKYKMSKMPKLIGALKMIKNSFDVYVRIFVAVYKRRQWSNHQHIYYLILTSFHDHLIWSIYNNKYECV